MSKTAPRRLSAIALVVVCAAASVAGACTSTASPTSTSADIAAAIRPDPALTPGDVASANVNEICVSGYAKRARNVSTETKNAVYAEYHIATHSPGEYEVDHLIPLGIGGSNDIKNLWPQPTEPRPGRLEKDELEDELHKRICDHSVDVEAAQREIATDWPATYRKYILHR